MRFTIPRPRSRTILRPRILSQLARWPELRLIQLIAPAGYGKTTLAAGWIHSLVDRPADQRPTIAWISVTESIAADQLLRFFLDALEPHFPRLHDLRHADGGVDFAGPLRVRMLCDELAAADQPLLLVLDDVHLLIDPAAHALLQQILDASPPPLHLVVLSRTTPPLRLGRLILDDALLTFNAHDLAFDHDEFHAFARDLGLDAQPADVLAALEQRSTGWITALKLLAYDLRYQLPAAPALSSDDALDDFFESRVLTALPDDLQATVDLAAPLPYMSAELLAAVALRPAAECADRLHALAAANTFVTAFVADGQPASYRFHPLFHDFLRRRAARHPHPDAEHMRARAAVWLCDHDDVDGAIALIDDGRRTTDDSSSPSSADRRLSSVVGYSDSLLLPASVVDSLTRAVRRAVLRYDHVAVRRWLRAVPEAWVSSHAPLALAASWHAWADSPDDVQHMLDTWQRAVDAVDALPNEPQFDELRAEATVLRALRHLVLNEREELRRVVDDAERAPRDSNGLAAAYLHLLRAAFLDVADDLDPRIQRLQTAANICEHIGFSHGAIEMMLTQLLLQSRHCRFESAQATAAHLQAVIAREGWRLSSYAPEIHYYRGEMYYLTDQLAAARPSLQLAVDSGRADGPTPTPYAHVARMLLQMCDAAEAPDGRATFDAAADAAAWVECVRSAFPLNRNMIACTRLRRDFRIGRIDDCRQTYQSMQLTLADLDEHAHDNTRLAVLTGAVFSGHTDEVITAKLAEFITLLEAAHFDIMRIHVQALQALNAHQRGDVRSARRLLQELLPEIGRTGMVRALLDLPPLHQHLAECSGPVARRLAAQLRTPDAAPRDYGLTRQEHTILDQLADGTDPKDIAAAHSLSVGTVRVHIHRIYRKLQVNSREEAVQVWRRNRE